MRELEQIDQANTEAVQRSIPGMLLQGYFVVAEYAGLNFVAAHQFRGALKETTALVQAKVDQLLAQPGAAVKVFFPALEVTAKDGDIDAETGRALSIYEDRGRTFMSPVEE